MGQVYPLQLSSRKKRGRAFGATEFPDGTGILFAGSETGHPWPVSPRHGACAPACLPWHAIPFPFEFAKKTQMGKV